VKDFLRNNLGKIIGVFLLVIITSLLGFGLWHWKGAEWEFPFGPFGPTPTKVLETPITASTTCLVNETEPEEFGNDEKPIPYGELDSEGSRLAKLSQLNTIQIKGVVIIKNDEERALTLRIHKEDKIKVKVLPGAQWVVVYGSRETRPEDFWDKIRVGDEFQGICVDSQCSAVSHAAVIRSS
jgi:hypothetical protein